MTALTIAGWFVSPVIEKLIKISSEYLKDQISWQRGMKKKLERLEENHPKIQSVVNHATEAQIRNPGLNRWLWQLRDTIDEADDLLDEIEYMKYKEHVAKNCEETNVHSATTSILFETALNFGSRLLMNDPILNRLEEVVHKLDEVSSNLATFYQLVHNAKQEQEKQQDDLHKNREEGSLPKNVLIGRGEDMKYVIRWLRQTSNEEHPTDITSTSWYNISIFSIVGRWLRQTSNEEHPTHIPSTAWHNISIFSMVGRWLRQTSNEEHPTHIASTAWYNISIFSIVGRWLRQTSNEEHPTHIPSRYNNISIFSIVGHGGMGKTTLLQHVYEDEITKEFDLKMWACVSINFDVNKVTKNMLESLKKKKCEFDSLDALQGCLKSEVSSKKFLLVLDDIWEEDERKFEKLLAPLAYGKLGSKILVTTRMNSVATMIENVIKKKNKTLILKGLEEDECLQLLNTHAFGVENPEDHKKLKSITVSIATKLLGSPLAAKVIGGALSSNLDERYWIKVLNSDFKSSEFGQNEILPILRLSYTFLQIPLQNCFAFCSIFSQDHEIEKDALVRMWIAVGFIQPPSSSNSRETMEDIGERYFNILVKKSFFDKLEHCARYKIHDLLHELAQSVFAQESFRVVHDEDLFRIPNTIRHLVVETSNFKELKWIIKFKNLRSLHLTYKKDHQEFVDEKDDQEFVDVLIKIFEASRSLRLLHVNALYLKFIPEEIGCLIHLRYLNITADIALLPRSLSNLYHLQFIIYYKFCSCSDYFFPKDMNNLFNLRHLTLPFLGTSGIHGIGKLTSLQKLDEFHVKDENGYKIGELEHMNKLRDLAITHLQNVKDAMEVCNAKLCDKWDLTQLSLQWGNFDKGITRQNIADPDLDERVLDNLQPHNNLKRLTIVEYMGVRSTIWMNKTHLISNLEYIYLEKCLEWQTLPPFGQLPFLKSLYLMDMPNVKRIENKFHMNDRDCSFPSLTVLHIQKLESLEEWFDAAAATATHECFFPCLIELCLEDCPNLQELPYLPPKLEIFEMNNTGWKTLNFFSISKSIPLRTLIVRGCTNITYIPLADEIARFAALRYLTVVDCPNLNSLGGHQEVEIAKNCQLTLDVLSISDPSLLRMEPLRSITSLKNLNIIRNDELVSFPTEVEQWFHQVSTSLCCLEFRELKSLQSLPSSLESLSSLKSLYVSDVPQLMQLPNIPASMDTLRLEKLNLLQPSSLSTVSSLRYLNLCSIPLLKSLPDLPPSLNSLYLYNLENVDCLPSCLPSLSSLTIINFPQLRELPDLPSSLCNLELRSLENLNCLPYCLPSLSSLKDLVICNVPQLRELPDLPPSLNHLFIKNCHSELMERYKKFSGSDWHKIAHIPGVSIVQSQDGPL